MSVRAHFDPTTGASGDMILGALVDAGAPLPTLRASLASLGLPEIGLVAEEIRTRGMRGTRVTVDVPDEKHERHLPEIRDILASGDLPEKVVANALRVFDRLADAEARAHGIDRDRVHFHEVGALDAIVDIAGTALALELLGVDHVTFSPLHVGTGEVMTAHGMLPVPVPAVVELTKGVPIVRTGIEMEILTPTGAALLTTLGRPVDGVPQVTERVGVGCGTRELPDRPNMLRVSIGAIVRSSESPVWEHDEVVVLETQVDDMSAEAWPRVMEGALEAGALDVYLTPVIMKRGRPAHLLTALAEPPLAAAVARWIFRETTTFGIRRSAQPRWKLAREIREISSPWGAVRVKVGDLGDGALRVTPEFEACREIADRTGEPLLDVYREVETRIRSDESFAAPGGEGT